MGLIVSDLIIVMTVMEYLSHLPGWASRTNHQLLQRVSLQPKHQHRSDQRARTRTRARAAAKRRGRQQRHSARRARNSDRSGVRSKRV